jgi:hypothetical protein
MWAVGAPVAAVKVGQQIRKGDWTTDPGDSNYLNHWDTISKPRAEINETVYFGQQVVKGRIGSKSNFVVVRVGNEDVYLDTPKVERVGPVASVAGFFLDRSGLSTPREIPRSQVTVREFPQRERIEFQFPDGSRAIGKTDIKIGRPSDLSAKEQWKHFKSVLRR